MAACLKRRGGLRKAWPSQLVFTDPARTPDPIALAARLPRGVALVYRAFGAADADLVARKLRDIARRRGFLLLIGADARLAARVGADGVHLPERLAHHAHRIRRFGWWITAAAHSVRAARVSGVDAVVVSAVFHSTSRSAGPPLGPVRLANIARASGALIYALGGVNDATAARLNGTGVIGLAAVDVSKT